MQDADSVHQPVRSPVSIGRRSFLAGVGFLPLLKYVPRSTLVAAHARQPGSFRFFDDHQAAVVTEASARLIPGPQDDPAEEGHPGAREAGVVFYIDLFLSAFDDDPPRIFAGGPWSDRSGGEEDHMADFVPLSAHEEQLWRERIADLQERYRAGIAALDAAADGGDFTAVGVEAQDAILLADTPDGFRRLLFEHAIEGTYSVPEYGGNHELVGWTETSSAGDVAPTGWTADQTSESDGPDPAPEGVALPFPAEVAEQASEGGELLPEGGGSDEGAAPLPGTGAAGRDPSAEIADLDAFFAAALPGLSRARARRGPGG
ncbi:MAG: hypothetical protein JJLCMIEE_03666 [Acidimicrobiales bacterium]|nr:hypothetical protein [Acidimicrobiales bacterium]